MEHTAFSVQIVVNRPKYGAHRIQCVQIVVNIPKYGATTLWLQTIVKISTEIRTSSKITYIFFLLDFSEKQTYTGLFVAENLITQPWPIVCYFWAQGLWIAHVQRNHLNVKQNNKDNSHLIIQHTQHWKCTTDQNVLSNIHIAYNTMRVCIASH